jgi:hypothetical protein
VAILFCGKNELKSERRAHTFSYRCPNCHLFHHYLTTLPPNTSRRATCSVRVTHLAHHWSSRAGLVTAALARKLAFSFPRMLQWLGIHSAAAVLCFAVGSSKVEFVKSSAFAVGWRFAALVRNWIAKTLSL